jgi:hypothetical protein
VRFAWASESLQPESVHWNDFITLTNPQTIDRFHFSTSFWLTNGKWQNHCQIFQEIAKLFAAQIISARWIWNCLNSQSSNSVKGKISRKFRWLMPRQLWRDFPIWIFVYYLMFKLYGSLNFTRNRCSTSQLFEESLWAQEKKWKRDFGNRAIFCKPISS